MASNASDPGADPGPDPEPGPDPSRPRDAEADDRGWPRWPRIGLPTYVETARWGPWERPAALLPHAYVAAVVAAGGLPVLLPARKPQIWSLLPQATPAHAMCLYGKGNRQK